MATLVKQSTSNRYERIPAWLRELDFVTDGFTWLFRLMSRGAEPLMTLSTIYVIIEAGVPAVSLNWLHFLAVAIMISAPEIILPGGFILAGEIRAQGNRHAWLLYSMCWLFVVLTGATLADIFIWHFTGDAFAALMWFRCVAAVGYSILFRVITYHRHEAGVPTAAAPDVLALVEQQLSDQARQFQAELERRFSALSSQLSLQFHADLEQNTSALSDQVQATIQREISALPEQLSGLISAQKQEEISLDSGTQLTPESSETQEQEAAQEASAVASQSRKYFVTFEEASAMTGLTILQLKRRVSAGEIEVGSGGKVRVKSLQNLQQKPRKAQKKAPVLSLVKSSHVEAVNE